MDSSSEHLFGAYKNASVSQPGAGIDRYARGQASINKGNDNFIESSMQQQSQVNQLLTIS